MYELDSIRSEVRAAGLQKQPFRLRRPGMPATGPPPSGSLDPTLSEKHGDIISASVSPATYSMPGGGVLHGVHDISNNSSSTRSSNKKLGELAMAELLWQVNTMTESPRMGMCVVSRTFYCSLCPILLNDDHYPHLSHFRLRHSPPH
jgi:hypothetical protein